MIEEQYVTLETAKLAKEKGFNEFCFRYYNGTKLVDTNGISINNEKLDNEFEGEQFYAAPTQALLSRWLREKHDIDLESYRTWAMDKSYNYEIIVNCNFDDIRQECAPDRTYEESKEKGLQVALNLI